MEIDLKKEKLNRLGEQLRLTEQMLASHPLTENRFGIARASLHLLHLQTRWSSGGSLTRFLIGLKTALQGHLIEESASGFIGPHLEKCRKTFCKLLSTTIPKEDLGKRDLLSTASEVIFISLCYLCTQILGERKELFPKTDPASAKKGELLYQELGLIWLLGSQTIENSFQALAKALEIDENGQKMIGDLSKFFILVLLIALTEEKKLPVEEWIESLHGFMLKPLDSIELALEKSQNRDLFDADTLMTTSSQIQLLRQILQTNDFEELISSIHNGFQAFDMSYDGLKKDLLNLEKFCHEVNQIFKNIFHQTQKTMTTMDQAA